MRTDRPSFAPPAATPPGGGGNVAGTITDMVEPGTTRRGSMGGQALAGMGALTSGVPMVAMLPGGVAGVLGPLGLNAGSGVVIWLAGVLGPAGAALRLASTALLAVAGLRCGLLAVGTALIGGALMYLSMYVVVRADGTTTSTLFYPGLVLFLGSYLAPRVQRRRRGCHPLVDAKRGRALLVAVLVAGGALVVATTVLGLSLSPSSDAMQGMGG